MSTQIAVQIVQIFGGKQNLRPNEADLLDAAIEHLMPEQEKTGDNARRKLEDNHGSRDA